MIAINSELAPIDPDERCAILTSGVTIAHESRARAKAKQPGNGAATRQ